MKHTFVCAAVAALLCGCGGTKSYTIEGSGEELAGMVYLFDGADVIDSAAVENGAFRLKGTADAPKKLRLFDNRLPEEAELSAVFYAEPGTIRLTADEEVPGRYVAAGTPANDASIAYEGAAKALISEYRDPDTSDERREAIEEEYDALTERSVSENLGNLFGAELVQQTLYGKSGAEIIEALDRFTKEMQQCEQLVSLREYAEQKSLSDVGQHYIDITLPDATGTIVTLSSVVGRPETKYTLIDFWASWCRPCMGEVPHLKAAYDKYHKAGFEIYGITLDRNRDQWIDAVEQNAMNWIHVGKFDGEANAAAKDYAVQSIPSNFLVDSEGVIIATNLRGEELEAKIAELLD